MLLIDKWLSGNRNFIIGTNLYKLYGTNTALVNLLEKGETTYSRKLLEEALVEINSTVFVAPLPKPAEVAVRVSLPMEEEANIVLDAIHKEWTTQFNEMKHLQHVLDSYGTDNSQVTREKCKPICKAILELEQSINELWQKRDYYKKHKKLPETKEEDEFVVPTNPLEIAKAIDSATRSLRRNKAALKNNPDKPQYALLIEKYEQRLKLLTNEA